MRGSQNFSIWSAICGTARSSPWAAKKAAIWFAIITSLACCMLDLPPAWRGRHALDSMGMREHLEAVGASDRYQRDAGLLCGVQGERGRRRDSRHDGESGDRRLLHHLD